MSGSWGKTYGIHAASSRGIDDNIDLLAVIALDDLAISARCAQLQGGGALDSLVTGVAGDLEEVALLESGDDGEVVLEATHALEASDELHRDGFVLGADETEKEFVEWQVGVGEIELNLGNGISGCSIRGRWGVFTCLRISAGSEDSGSSEASNFAPFAWVVVAGAAAAAAGESSILASAGSSTLDSTLDSTLALTSSTLGSSTLVGSLSSIISGAASVVIFAVFADTWCITENSCV